MPDLQEIEQLTEAFANALQDADEVRIEIEDEVARIKRRHLARLRRRAAKAKDAHAALLNAIKESPALFERPKTRTFHGIKVGYRKQPGALSWADDEKVIAKIKQHFGTQTDVLIKTTEKPVRDALAQLPADSLKRLGITVVATGDEPVIKSVIGDLEKLIEAIVGEVGDEEEAADVVL